MRLTDEQRIFAELNHNLVYKYLFVKHLDLTEFYDVVIFGYLNAVCRYFTEAKLRKYQFSTIAWRAMDSSLANYFKYLGSAKRTGQILSIDTTISETGSNLYDFTAVDRDIEDAFSQSLFWYDLRLKLSFMQYSVARLKSFGFSNKEIMASEKLGSYELRQIISNIKFKIKNGG